MKKTILLLGFVAVLFSSCRKEPVAAFDYYLDQHQTWQEGVGYKTDYVTVSTYNYSSNANDYEWELISPNSPSQPVFFYESNPVFVCHETGDYSLKLSAYNRKGGVSTAVKVFHIDIDAENPDDPSVDPALPPTASFNISSSNGSYAPSIISCTNTSTNATHYAWTLTKPDYTSTTSTNKNPSFNCTQSGSYTLQLIAYNANNQSDVYTRDFTLTSPTSFTITWLRLETIPMLDANNASWDTGTFTGADPDIFFTLTESGETTVLYQSSVKDNTAAADFPVTWIPVNQTLTFGNNYVVKFWDADDLTLDGNDLMASCLLSSSHLTPGTTSFTWNNNDIGVRFVIGLTWQ